jgi:hypothetical protein
MYAYNIRFGLQMEIDPRYVVSYLHRKGMKLPAIVAEIAAAYYEDEFDENILKYWLHEIKLHRSDLSDRPPLEDIDARVLRVLEAEPWSSVRTIAEFLKIPASTAHLHLITSLNMKSRHFKWVPHLLDGDSRAKRLEVARQLLGVLQAQAECRFEI